MDEFPGGERVFQRAEPENLSARRAELHILGEGEKKVTMEPDTRKPYFPHYQSQEKKKKERKQDINIGLTFPSFISFLFFSAKKKKQACPTAPCSTSTRKTTRSVTWCARAC
jgi:hypothetical protein